MKIYAWVSIYVTNRTHMTFEILKLNYFEEKKKGKMIFLLLAHVSCGGYVFIGNLSSIKKVILCCGFSNVER